jgi:hypothetical protein
MSVQESGREVKRAAKCPPGGLCRRTMPDGGDTRISGIFRGYESVWIAVQVMSPCILVDG